ncbi:Os02g0601350, partial [Oryza sativa Japonica Group]
MDSGHQTLNDAKSNKHLGERSQAVGGATSVGDNVNVRLVLLLVDTNNEHGGVFAGSRNDDLLGTTLQVSCCLVLVGENTSRLNNVFSTSRSPWDLLR